MSTPFYDLASLVVVPSGVKATKVYAQKPMTTDGQLTFSRASTATRVNASGLIETVSSNVPRLDYLGSTCPKLQLEPQRSNLLLQSSALDNASWTTFRSSVTANATTSPDGGTNAEKLIQQSGENDGGGVYQSLTIANATAHTYSFFAKAAGYNFTYARVSNSPSDFSAWFNLSTGVVGTTTGGVTSSSIVSYGNGWYRCSMTFTSAGTSAIPHIYIANADGSAQTPGADGVKGIFAYGAMLEAGAYPTSLINTTTAAVTRLEENAVKTSISSLLGQTEGTLFIEIDPQDISGQGRHISMESASGEAGGWIGIFSTGATPNTFRFYGNGFDFSGGPALRGVRAKAALAYKNGVLTSAYVNGVSVGTLTANTNGKSYAKLELAAGPFGNGGSCNYRQALVFKTALTNAQLAELTAL
jgi:hypothetical protein